MKSNLDARRVVGSMRSCLMDQRKRPLLFLPFSIEQTQELFTLTYGAFVAQILSDYEHVDEVNKQLDKM